VKNNKYIFKNLITKYAYLIGVTITIKDNLLY